MMNRIVLTTIIALASCGWIRRDGDGGPATGDERGPCYPNDTCNEGLVCASERCVSVDGAGTDGDADEGTHEDTEDTGWDPPPRPPSTTGDNPLSTCADMLQTCSTRDRNGCIYDYVLCQEGQDPCAAFYGGCDLIEWTDSECSSGSESQSIFCGSPGTTSMGEPDPYGSSEGGEWPQPYMDLGV